MKVKISEIIEINKRLNEINRLSLDEIEFLDDEGNNVEIDETIMSDFKFTGLNNTDFIFSGFYQTGFDY